MKAAIVRKQINKSRRAYLNLTKKCSKMRRRRRRKKKIILPDLALLVSILMKVMKMLKIAKVLLKAITNS